MAKIAISALFRGHQRLFEPGTYEIPAEISASEARCCVADGAGVIIREAAPSGEPFREPGVEHQKQPAPENKQRGAAPENKSPLDNGGGSGDGTKPDAGSRKRAPRAKRPGGE